MRVLLLMILFYSIITPTNAQNESTWQRFYGGIRADEIEMSLENYEGDLIAVGSTKSKAFRGQDVLFRVLDSQGQVKIKQNFGGKKNDQANSFLQTYDGGYIVVGKTNSKWEDSQGKDDAWIVKTNEAGEPLWHRSFGGKKDDAFQDVLQLQDGSIVAVGKKDDKPFIIRLSSDGEDIIWEKTERKTGAVFNAVIMSKQGEIVLVGTTGKDKTARAFFTKLDVKGKTIQRLRTINDAKLRSAEDIIQDRSKKQYAIVGNFASPDKRENIGLVKIDEKGKTLWLKDFGGYGTEQAQSIIQTVTGQFVLSGLTNSHLPGARRSRGWVKFVDSQGEDLNEELYGGNQNDYFCFVNELQDGSMLIGGSSASNIGPDRDAWLVKTGPERKRKDTSIDIKISEVKWNEEIKNDSLDANERAYISFLVVNQKEEIATGLKAIITYDKDISGLNSLKEINLGTIFEKEEKLLSIPISGDLELISGNVNIDVKIVDANGKTVDNFDFDLKTNATPLPKLEFVNVEFLTENELPERNEIIKMTVEVKNIGNAKATETGTRIFLPQRIKPISEKVQLIGDLGVGESKTITFEFKAKSYYEFDSIAIRTVVFEESMRRGAKSVFGLKIKNFYDIEDDPTFIVEPKNNFLQNTGSGPSVDFDVIDNQVSDIYWKAPDQDEEGYNHDVISDYISIKIRVKSDVELKDDDFNLHINGKKAIDKKNIDQQATALEVKQSFRDNSYSYTYITKILLEEGENLLTLKVKTKEKWEESDPMTIIYELPRHNLHVYSFGVPHDDLKFTTKDAKDFAESFDNQTGKIFNEINVHTFTTPEKTTDDYLEEAFEDIAADFLTGATINENDGIIIYLSSHGFVLPSKQDEFRLACSGFDLMRPRSSSVEFSEIIEILDEIPEVHRYVFVDACYSGAIANMDEGAKSNDDPIDPAISKAVIDLASATKGYNTIVSCSAGELSYEDSEWNNGAFTEAILEAFNNKDTKMISGEMAKADTDNDKVLTTKELYLFLQERVPALVKTKHPKLPKSQSQTPFMPEEHLENSLPLFSIK